MFLLLECDKWVEVKDILSKRGSESFELFWVFKAPTFDFSITPNRLSLNRFRVFELTRLHHNFLDVYLKKQAKIIQSGLPFVSDGLQWSRTFGLLFARPVFPLVKTPRLYWVRAGQLTAPWSYSSFLDRFHQPHRNCTDCLVCSLDFQFHPGLNPIPKRFFSPCSPYCVTSTE